MAQSSDDSMITRAVSLEIAADPVISSQSKIRVASENGIVVLEGSVPHGCAAERAVAAARRTMGVRGVVERLRIRSAARSDALIHGDLQQLIHKLDSGVAERIRLVLQDARVAIGGSVTSRAQRELIEAMVWTIRGVRGVANHLVVEACAQRPDSDILREVAHRIDADHDLESAQLAVEVTGGRVTITGEVGSTEQRRRAHALAWVPGVCGVEDAVVVRAASGSRFKVVSPRPDD